MYKVIIRNSSDNRLFLLNVKENSKPNFAGSIAWDFRNGDAPENLLNELKQCQEEDKNVLDTRLSKTKAKEYLKSTDWYVTRKMDTGAEIPEEVKLKRQACREIL